MLPPSPRTHGRTPSQLEDAIEWRQHQLQALHQLRLRLAALQDGGSAPPVTCRLARRARGGHDGTHIVIGLARREVPLDTRFLEPGELRALEGLIASRANPEAIPALRRKVAERIDELNQLNRCTYEVLRIIAVCRGEPNGN